MIFILRSFRAFVIFRFIGNYKYTPKVIESKLEATDNITKVSAQIGREGKLRVVVAAPTWYGEPTWEKWWSTLAKRISGAIK